MFSVPGEASIIVGLAALLAICATGLYVYISKQSCFNTVSKCWCCQKTPISKRNRISKELVSAFSYEDELDSSSECDEDVMRQLQQERHCNSRLSSYLNETHRKHRQYDKLLDCDKVNSLESTPEERKELTSTSKSKYSQLKRQHSICADDDKSYDHINNNKTRSRNLLKQQALYASLALKSNSKTFEMILGNGNQQQKLTGNDLISLAEKGRIGKQTSTEGSISSEAGSTEDAMLDKKSALKRLKKTVSECESKDSNEGHKYQILNSYLDNYESDTQSSNLPDFSPNTTMSEPNMVPVAKCGRLEVGFAYDAPSKRLFVTVIQGNEIPYREQRTGVNQVFVKVIMLPHKKQRFKTKSKPIFCPIFNESFTFNRLNPEEIINLGLRFRVYSIGFARKTHLIGESYLMFSYIKPQQQETKLWFNLEPHKRNCQSDLRSESSSLARTDSTSSQSLHNSMPELLLGLSYNGTTGRLSVTIIKGSQFRGISMRAPDTFVKLALISSSGNEIARSKTSICRGQPNPHFKETFIFQVALFQLPDVTLMIFAYNKRSIKRKELVGWISLGYNNSGEEEMSHWNDMRDNKGEQVARWHILRDS